jgi:hypothetical protein
MILYMGMLILLAPDFYARMVTVGGNSPGSNSTVGYTLQQAMKTRIVHAS